MTTDSRVHIPWPLMSLIGAFVLPIMLGFYSLGGLAKIVESQGALIAKIDSRLSEFDALARAQAKRDAEQDAAQAQFRVEITAKMAEQTAVLNSQTAVLNAQANDLRAIRDMLARMTQFPVNGGGR